MKKSLFVLLALLLLGAALGACSPDSPPAQTTPGHTDAEELVVTDFMDRSVTISDVPQRIASLTPSNTELICALGLQDKLVGVDDFSNYPEGVADLPKVGDYSGPNLENILALAPDIVFAGNKLQNDVISSLETHGITVIAAESTTYEGIYASVDLIAAACGVSASELKSEMRAVEEDIRALVAGKPAHSVYYIAGFGEYGDYSIGKENYMTDLFALAGLDVVTKEQEYSWPMYSIEKLLEDNPDYIICDTYLNVEELRSATGYRDLDAVKNDRIVVLEADQISRPARRCLDAVLALAKAVYE